MKKEEKEIIKIHKETCNPELKEASFLLGKETEKEIHEILDKCLDIQGITILNDLRKS